jgi:hypothetical protein
MRKATIGFAGLVATGAIVLGSALPALADANPVHATVRVATVLSLDGISPNVAFGTVIPGQSSTVQAAESPHVITNGAGGQIFVTNANGGFHYAIGAPDQIPNSAVSVTTPGQGTVALGDNPVSVASFARGDHTYAQDWSINVPATVAASDPGQSLFADYSYSAVAG